MDELMHGCRSVLYSLLLIPTIAFAHFGVNFSYILAPQELPDLHGYQFMLDYYPFRNWNRFTIYFDAGFSHFKVLHKIENNSLNALSLAPVLRVYGNCLNNFLPYVDLSVGLTYLSDTHVGNRNLGIHFSFQDRFGIGVLIGHQKKLSIGFHAVHYSNAHLSKHNSGFTAPLVLDVGYRF